MEDIIEKSAYEAIKELNPSLLEAIESALSKGGTARQLERKLNRRYGKNVETVNCAILAAYHVERQRKSK